MWTLLRELTGRAEVTAYCSFPRYWPRFERHRDFIHDAPWLEAFADVPAATLRFPAVPRLTRPLNGWFLSHPLRRALRRDRPDAVVAIWVHPEGYAALRACRALDLPLVVISLGSDLKRLSRNPLIRRQVRAVVAQADRLLGVSEDLCETARRLGGSRVGLLPLGIDERIYRPTPRKPAPRKLVFFAGRFIPLKGLPRLIDALALLERSEPDRWQVALAGNGSREAALRRQVDALGLRGAVKFLGPLPPEEVARWMNTADVVCLPSESEGRPNVILEALSCGCPVVATPVGGVPEIVGPECGILVSQPGPQSLARALRHAASRTWDRAAIAKLYRRPWSEVAGDLLNACAGAVAARAQGFTAAAAPG